MAFIKLVKPSSNEEKHTHTVLDTIELTPKLIAAWKSPPFQRELKINAKVQQCGEEIKQAGGVLPGVITIGVLDGQVYTVDGQHRIAGWLHSGMETGYADVRTHWFNTMAEMAAEYVTLNSPLVRMRPDDILHGMEASSPHLQRIRRKCGFVGYDLVRRSERAPVVSMSAFLRLWTGSRHDAPTNSGSGMAALGEMDENETTHAIDFLGVCFEAWRRDHEYARLWGTLNLSLSAWLYRRMVLGERVVANTRFARFSKDDFRKCLLGLSAEAAYLEYLVGRNNSAEHRPPTYQRIKAIFQKRYLAETGKPAKLPSPPWAHGYH